MENKNSYTKEELNDPKVFEKMLNVVENALNYDTGLTGDQRLEVSNLRLKLERSLKIHGSALTPELRNKYLGLLAQLKFFNLYQLTENEILDMFRNAFVYALKSGIDVAAKLKLFLFDMPFRERDPFLEKVRVALKENEERIGTGDLDIEKEEKKEKPYLKNWIYDYESMLGAGKHGKLDISNYLFKDNNVKRLDADERRLLKAILEFYELSKLELNDPGALSAYSLPTYGIKSVGTGFKKRFMPTAEAVSVVKPEPEPSYLVTEEDFERLEEKAAKPKSPLEERAEKLREQKEMQKKPEKKVNLPKSPLEERAAQLQKPKEARREVPERKPEKIKEGGGPVKMTPEKPKPERAKKDVAFDVRAKKAKAPKPIAEKTLDKLSTPQSVAQLNIADFRNFGKDVKSSAEYLLNKINKLASYSPLDKETVKNSLRRSELYKLYLSQGKESLDLKKSAEDVAEIRKRDGRSFMSGEEFEAVKTLFKSL